MGPLAESPILSVRDVSMHFGGIVALDGVSFDMAEGQIVGLIGPNGAGKTTLFNCLSRLYTPDRGQLLLRGASIMHATAHRISGRRAHVSESGAVPKSDRPAERDGGRAQPHAERLPQQCAEAPLGDAGRARDSGRRDGAADVPRARGCPASPGDRTVIRDAQAGRARAGAGRPPDAAHAR